MPRNQHRDLNVRTLSTIVVTWPVVTAVWCNSGQNILEKVHCLDQVVTLWFSLFVVWRKGLHILFTVVSRGCLQSGLTARAVSYFHVVRHVWVLVYFIGYGFVSGDDLNKHETVLTGKKKAHSPLKVKYGQSTDGDVISATWRQEQLTLSAFQNHSWELRVVHKCLESSHPCICASRVLSLHNWMTPW